MGMNGYSFSLRFIRWPILGLISQACTFAAPSVPKDIEYSQPNGYPLLLDLYLPERVQD
tara:strand:- start:7472 stop:7648 length:177 start_codon:yes stop_codon:yes gene_type:complete